MVAISSAVRRRPTAATQRSTRSPAEGSAVLGWTATRGGSQRECAERAPQDTSVATTRRKRRRGIDDKQSTAHEKEEDKSVTPARPQKGSGMTTWAYTLCSCVMRQTATRKQFRNAVVNHIASKGCAAAEGEPNDWAQTGLGVRNMVAALAVLDAGFCPSNRLAGNVRIARKRDAASGERQCGPRAMAS